MSEDRRTTMFRGKIIAVDLDVVELPNGSTAEFEIVRHPGGAAAVAIDGENNACLLRQYRYVAGGWLWELPAGKLDPGEGPLVTAQRELAEEAGLRAAKWEPLGRLISSPGVFSEVVSLYLARDLAPVEPDTEEHELIEVHWVPMAQALDWARSGEIVDAKTLVGLFRAEAFLNAL